MGTAGQPLADDSSLCWLTHTDGAAFAAGAWKEDWGEERCGSSQSFVCQIGQGPDNRWRESFDHCRPYVTPMYPPRVSSAPGGGFGLRAGLGLVALLLVVC